MVGLISSTEAVGIRAALSIFFTHVYTRERETTSGEDAWGNETATPGIAVAALPCKYRQQNRAVRDETGVTIVSTPTLKVPHDDPLTTGDRITSILNSEGVVLLAGPLIVGVPLNSDGLGPTLAKRFELIAATAVRAA